MEIRECEQKIPASERVDRVFRLLAECNRTVIREKEEKTLLREICRLIVRVGEYRLAWVAFVMQDADRSVCPVAQAGFEAGLTQSDIIGKSLAKNAIRANSTKIVHDIMADPKYKAWRPEASRLGYASTVALPFTAKGRVLGALNIYAIEPDAFNTLEIELLEMLSTVVTYGILSLRAYLKLERNAMALAASEARYRGIFENTKNGVMVFRTMDNGKSFVLVEINLAAEILENVSKEKVQGKNLKDIFPKIEEFGFFKVLQRVWSSGKPEQFTASFDTDNLDCGCRQHFIYKLPSCEIVSVYTDESERKRSEATLRNNIEKTTQDLRTENLKLKATLKDRYRFGKIIGKSSSMKEVYDLILQAAASGANVLIYGETGTGKELIARTIHEMSERSNQNFVPVNCGAIPETIFESEFFGHRKGAFTGAYVDKPGFFDLAHKGTLFLDEVGELTLNMQAKLLRAIEGGGYTPVGDNSIKQADIRIISATNRNMAEAVKKGILREDFYYRIHVIPISVPPLKERREDIPLLVEHIMNLYADGKERKTIPQKIMAAFKEYDWSGNVRELQNVLQRFLATDKMDLVGPSDLDFLGPAGVHKKKLPTADKVPEAEILDFRNAVQKFEKNLIINALEKNRWHRAKAAEMLNLPRRTFFRKLSEFELT